MQVVVNSLLTHYETTGKGKIIVLLHGWADSSVGLRSLQKSLAQTYQVITPDLPGFGGTQAPSTTWGLDDYVQFVANFLAKLEITSVWAIIGHSNGGAIAIRGLAQEKLRAQHLVLLAAAGIRGTQSGRNNIIKLLTKTGKLLTIPLPKAIKGQLRRRVYTAVGSDMLVAEHLQETFKRIVNQDVRTDAARITQPTLLIYGERDNKTPKWYGETYARLMKHATLYTVPDAGHFLHIDQPDKVSTIIKEFIA